MSDTDKPKTYIKTLKEFFGFREGQDLAGFGKELKDLSDEEKAQLGEGIENGSLDY